MPTWSCFSWHTCRVLGEVTCSPRGGHRRCYIGVFFSKIWEIQTSQGRDSYSAGITAKANRVYLLTAVLLIQNSQTNDISKDLQAPAFCTSGFYEGYWCVWPEEEDKVDCTPWKDWALSQVKDGWHVLEGFVLGNSNQWQHAHCFNEWLLICWRDTQKFRMSSLPQSWRDEHTFHVENVVAYPV